MPLNKLRFRDAEKARKNIMIVQKKKIAKMYEDWANDLERKILYYESKSTNSAPLQVLHLKQLQSQIRETGKQLCDEIQKGIQESIYTVSDAVINDYSEWVAYLGISTAKRVGASFSNVPDSIVRKVVTGQIYDTGWSLSSAIWSDSKKTQRNVYEIIAGGIAQNKSIYEMANDVQQFVSPSARKRWNLRCKDGRYIYPRNVDYAAQRLARTLTQHAYQQSVIEVTKNDPFVNKLRWVANGSRVCPLCREMDGNLYSPEDVPLDHPNGMCVLEPVVDKNIETRLRDWLTSPDGTDTELDEYAKNFM